MIYRDPAKTAWKQAQIRCHQAGAFVTIKWEEWTSSQQPNYDPTTGAMLTVGTGDVPLTAMLKTRAFTHFVGPTTSRARIFAEIKEGDCIMDFVIPILQIAAPGDTAFTVGQLVDIFCFGAANRKLASGQTLATAFEGHVQIDSLQNPAVWMYKSKSDWQNDQNGEEWVQQSIGKALAQSWETVWGGELLGQAMLLRKAT